VNYIRIIKMQVGFYASSNGFSASVLSPQLYPQRTGIVN